MTLAFALLAMAVAFAFIWRGYDVRVVLFAAALAVGFAAGQPGVVFRKTAESLADAKFLLPICSAMGFAFVVRETGCVDAMVRLLVRPIARVPRLVLPGSSAVALVVNMAIPSQTSTLAAVGPLTVALLARLRTRGAQAGAALVLGASISGALLNPGLAEVAAVAQMTRMPAPEVVVTLAPAVLVAFAIGIAALLVAARFGVGRGDAELATDEPVPSPDAAAEGTARPEAPPSIVKALLPPLPVLWLLLDHPSLPTHAYLAGLMLPRLEVFTAMLAGSAVVIAFATRERAKATRSLFEGAGYALTHVITIIAVSAGAAKALEVAGVLSAFVTLVAGNPIVTLVAAFSLAFGLAILSGSGTASSVALVTAIGPHAAELGVSPLTLGGVILVAAEAGRTTSPVAAVLLFGSSLVRAQPRTLAVRLVLPCLVGAAAGAGVYVLARGV